MEKIYVVTTAHPSNDARIYHREILSLAKKYQVIFLAPDNQVSAHKNVEVVSFEGLNRRQRWGAYYRYLRNQRAQIIHFHDLDFAPFAVALRWFHGAKVVFDKHEFTYLTIENRDWVPGFLKPVIKGTTFIIEKLFSALCNYLIVANPQQLTGSKKAVLLLNVPPRESYAKFIAGKDFRKMCYIGDVTKPRGANILISLAEKLPDGYSLTIAGKIRDEQIAKSLQTLPKVKILGFVPNDELWERIGDVGIGLVPFEEKEQYKKSVPSKIFDYLALGMIVIAADFTADSFKGADFSFNKKGVIFIKSNAESYLEKAKSVAEMEGKAAISKKNRSLFEERYNWDAEEKKLFDLYLEIVREG